MSQLFTNKKNLQEILEAVNNLPNAGGVELPELSNPANESEVFLNKDIIDKDGNKMTGTFTIENEIDELNTLIPQLRNTVDRLPDADSGEQATPEISVNTSGLITATAGTKSSTYQLAFQAAKTITPSTTSQIAVSSGYYTGGNITVASVPTQSKSVTPKSTSQTITPDSGKFLSRVTVAGDSNLVAGNIKSGVSIFGVSGTLSTGGGSGEAAEWSENEDAIITKTISSYTNDRVTTIGKYAFYSCASLTTVSFPACTSIGGNAFRNCASLTTVSFPVCTSIGSNAFYSCFRLSSLTLGASVVCTLSNSTAFASTPYAGYSSYFSGTPHIYVPVSLVDAYKSATNWTYFASYISAYNLGMDSGA